MPTGGRRYLFPPSRDGEEEQGALARARGILGRPRGGCFPPATKEKISGWSVAHDFLHTTTTHTTEAHSPRQWGRKGVGGAGTRLAPPCKGGWLKFSHRSEGAGLRKNGLGQSATQRPRAGPSLPRYVSASGTPGHHARIPRGQRHNWVLKGRPMKQASRTRGNQGKKKESGRGDGGGGERGFSRATGQPFGDTVGSHGGEVSSRSDPLTLLDLCRANVLSPQQHHLHTRTPGHSFHGHRSLSVCVWNFGIGSGVGCGTTEQGRPCPTTGLVLLVLGAPTTHTPRVGFPPPS